jgi:hypothetical protein
LRACPREPEVTPSRVGPLQPATGRPGIPACTWRSALQVPLQVRLPGQLQLPTKPLCRVQLLCRCTPHRGPSTGCFIHAVQRSVTVTRQVRCAASKEAATPNKLYVAIYGTGSLYLRRSRSYPAQTDLPVWTRSPRLGPRCIATRSSRWQRQWQSADCDDRRQIQARRPSAFTSRPPIVVVTMEGGK